MRLISVFTLFVALIFSVVADDVIINLGVEPQTDHGTMVLLSPIGENTTTSWNIGNNNSTDLTSQYVRSLVISNLALEDGSSLTLKPLNTKTPHVLTITGEGAASLPNLYLDVNVTYVLDYIRGPKVSNTSRTLLQASYERIVNDACTPIDVAEKKAFNSYNYPNNYPLQEYYMNPQCRMVSSPSVSIYVTFNDLDLAQGHSLEFSDQTGVIALTASNIPGDAIVANNTVFNFLRPFNPESNTQRKITDKLSGRGFSITLEALSCGGELNNTSGSFAFNATEKSEKCIWILRTPNLNLDKTINILNFSLTDGLENVVIHDSNSRKNDLKVNRTGAEYVNSTSETVIIEFTSTNNTAHLSWSTLSCPDRCISVRRCINPSQRCNGVNDCGDGSDELHCNGTVPIPPPKIETSTGVPGLVVVFVIIPISLILGILGTIFLPRLIARIRDRRYQEFREYSDVS